MKTIEVRVPFKTVERIDALAGSYGRPQFIREAIESLLLMKETKAAKTNSNSKSKRKSKT